jgi:hypothetical protein
VLRHSSPGGLKNFCFFILSFLSGIHSNLEHQVGAINYQVETKNRSVSALQADLESTGSIGVKPFKGATDTEYPIPITSTQYDLKSTLLVTLYITELIGAPGPYLCQLL